LGLKIHVLHYSHSQNIFMMFGWHLERRLSLQIIKFRNQSWPIPARREKQKDRKEFLLPVLIALWRWLFPVQGRAAHSC
jgi:hypothetical protein